MLPRHFLRKWSIIIMNDVAIRNVFINLIPQVSKFFSLNTLLDSSDVKIQYQEPAGDRYSNVPHRKFSFSHLFTFDHLWIIPTIPRLFKFFFLTRKHKKKLPLRRSILTDPGFILLPDQAMVSKLVTLTSICIFF